MPPKCYACGKEYMQEKEIDGIIYMICPHCGEKYPRYRGFMRFRV